MTGLIPKGEEPVPATAAPDESGQLLNTLEQEYNISLLPTDLAAIQELGFELLPQDGLAHMSGALQQLPGLLHGRNLQNTYQETYAEAYRLLIPEGCSNDSKMKITKLAEEFGPDAESMEFIGPDGKVKRHGGVQKIDPPDVRAQQIAYLAFSAASVATSQYFLYRIDKKLEAIEDTISDIRQFLELDKQTTLQGYYEYLSGRYSRLNSIMADDKLLQATLQQIQAINADTLGSIQFYRQKVQNELTSIKEKMEKQPKQAIEQAKASLSAYGFALFVHELTLVLEILLTQPAANSDLKQIRKKLSEQIAVYKQVCQSYQELVYEHTWKGIAALPEPKRGLDWFTVTTKAWAHETKKVSRESGPLAGVAFGAISGIVDALEGPVTVVEAAAGSAMGMLVGKIIFEVVEKHLPESEKKNPDKAKDLSWKSYPAIFASMTDAALKDVSAAHLKNIKDRAEAEMALYALPEQMQPGELNRIADSIGELDKLYHGPIELAVSGDQIYFRPLHEADPAAEEEQTG